MPLCITNIARVPYETVGLFEGAESATVHEAQGRKGLLADTCGLFTDPRASREAVTARLP